MKSITWISESKTFTALIVNEERVNLVVTPKKGDGEPDLSVNLRKEDLIGIADILSDAAYALQEKGVENG